MRHLTRFLALLLCVAVAAPMAQADILRDLAGTLKGAGDLLGDDAITTNVKDSKTEVSYLDDFTPLAQQPMSELKAERGGKLLVTPGSHVGAVESYCLHAGTYGPTRGNGYGLAPLKGPRSGLIRRILQKSPAHPEVKQYEIQSLIWTIEAGVDYKNMSVQMQQTLVTLLAGKNKIPSPNDWLLINGGWKIFIQPIVPTEKINENLQKLSELQRPLFLARNKIRQMNVIGGSFQELEQFSVLTGEPPKHKNDRDIPNSRWAYSKDEGLFVRFRPSGYRRTQIEVYCPEQFWVRVDKEGRIREIESGNKSYKLETLYDEGAAQNPQVSGLRLLRAGAPIFENRVNASLVSAIPHSTNLRDAKDVLRPGVSAHLTELQAMQGELIGKKPRKLTGLMVNLTNYRDGLAPALAALPDEQARLVLSDFITRAWIATAYQWIKEDKAGVRLAQRPVFAGGRNVCTEFNGAPFPSLAPSLTAGMMPFPALAGAGALALVPVAEVTVGVLASPAVMVGVGVVAVAAVGFAIYDAVAVPGNIGSQRLAPTGRLAPDQPRLIPPGLVFGMGSYVADYISSVISNSAREKAEEDEDPNYLKIYRVGASADSQFWAPTDPRLDADYFVHYGAIIHHPEILYNNRGTPVWIGYVLKSEQNKTWKYRPALDMYSKPLNNGYEEVYILVEGTVKKVSSVPCDPKFFNPSPQLQLPVR